MLPHCVAWGLATALFSRKSETGAQTQRLGVQGIGLTCGATSRYCVTG
jgi:hypothetical protein